MIKLDWWVSQGLSGLPIESALYEKRGEYEEQLRTAQESVKKLCGDVIADQHALASSSPEISLTPVDVDGLFSQAKSELCDAAQALRHAQDAETAFKPRHGLTREPNESEILSAVLLLLIVMFGEAAINGSFFYSAHMVTGPFAALLLSVLIAFVNVLVSACGGYFIGRWLNYGQNSADASEFRSARWRAQVLLLGFVIIMGWFHLSVGLVRAQESMNVVHSLEHYLALITIPEALFLILIGICMSVLAFYKGMNAFDDPYPGYGARHRAVIAKRETLRETYEAFAEDLCEQFDTAVDGANKTAKTHQRAVAQFNKKVRTCLDRYRELENTVSKAESSLSTDIALMAGHHRAARGVKAKATRTTLTHLVDFQAYLNIELPAFLHASASDAASAPIIEAKTEALRRLSQLYDRILQTEHGEKQ
ncbi:MAG: hypothetical protein DBP01_05195 [gamma proteobacterium symbiont of Ctena orbiculata]|nr:MAG: hypothetical protein DBP01_05195 [gamma proteobacterium symbiont of Ctena orbiculata]